MEIRPDEIGNILRDRIKGLETGEAELSEVGTVLPVSYTHLTLPTILLV